MVFSEHSEQWYYTLRAAGDTLILRNHYTLLTANNYKQLKDPEFKLKKGVDRKAILRVIFANVVSQTINSIESLLTFAYLGLMSKEKGVNHQQMKTWYFFVRTKDLIQKVQFLEKVQDFDIWKWVLWVADIEEINEKNVLSKEEISSIKKIYDEYIERTQFVFNFSLRFWDLFRSVRNATSHTLKIIPNANIKHNLSNEFDDVLLILDSDWGDNTPIKVPIVTGSTPLKYIFNFVTNVNQLEQSIIKNHTMSVQANGERLIPACVLADVTKFGKSDYYTTILRKYNKFPAIDVSWKKEDFTKELESQQEFFNEFWTTLKQLGTSIKHDDAKKPFFPSKKKP